MILINLLISENLLQETYYRKPTVSPYAPSLCAPRIVLSKYHIKFRNNTPYIELYNTMMKIARTHTNIARAFWTLSKGTKVGYIESIYRDGFIFSTDYITFRETSSNLAQGDVLELSTSLISRETKETMKLAKRMRQRTFVSIEYSQHFVGSPLNGDIRFPVYLHHIDVLGDEIITVAPTSNADGCNHPAVSY